jgi:hypothetical protein
MEVFCFSSKIKHILCIENQHCALGFVNVFIIIRLLHVSAPTCHPQGASLSSWVTWKLRQLCTASKIYKRVVTHNHVTHEDKYAPWGWQIGAETCSNRIIINTLTKPSAQCWFSMHNPAMHGTNIKNIFFFFPNYFSSVVPLYRTILVWKPCSHFVCCTTVPSG